MRTGVALCALTAALATGCCPLTPSAWREDPIVCAHCACEASERSLSRPLLCSTIGRDDRCCLPLWSPSRRCDRGMGGAHDR